MLLKFLVSHLDNVHQLVRHVHRFLIVNVLPLFLLLNRLYDILEHSPAIVHVQIDLARKNCRIHIHCANKFVLRSRSHLGSLHESEPHLVNATQDRLHGPLGEFEGVVRDFFGQLSRLQSQVLRPRLTLVVPFEQSEQILLFSSEGVLEVRRASDANSGVCSNHEQLVAVAKAKHFLIRGLLKRITSLHFSERVWLLRRI